MKRLQTLFREAAKTGLVAKCQASQLQFLASAAHARLVGRRNPCGLFAAIICRGLWHMVSAEDEHWARLNWTFVPASDKSGRAVPAVRQPVERLSRARIREQIARSLASVSSALVPDEATSTRVAG